MTLRVAAHGGCLGCRKALVSTGWAISLPFSTNGHKNCSSAFVGAHNSGSVGSFRSGEAFASQRALTNVSLLMSGCG